MKKKCIIFSTALFLILSKFTLAGSGPVIQTNGLNTSFTNFSAPAGDYINKLYGYWSGGWGYLMAYTNGGSSGTIMQTQDAQLFFSTTTAAPGNHITAIGSAGTQYLGVWTEAGSLGDIIYNAGSSSTTSFINFTAPAGEVITGFTASSNSGFVYLNAVSSTLTPTFISEIIQQVDVSIFPNPSKGNITLKTNSFKPSTSDQLEIYSLSGSKVFQSPFFNSISEINLDLPAGIYFIKIIGENFLQTKKLEIIQ